MSSPLVRFIGTDHLSTLLITFRECLTSGRFCDLQIVCGNGEVIAAHAIILSLASNYFKKIFSQMLEKDWEEQMIITVPDLSSSDLKVILDVIYNPNLSQVFPNVTKECQFWLKYFEIGPKEDESDMFFHKDVDLLSNFIDPMKMTLTSTEEEDVLVASEQFRRQKLESIPQFLCDWTSCTKSFPTSRRLQLHQRQVHGVNFRPLSVADLTCELCGVKVKTTTALEVHKRSQHSGEKPFKCPHCQKGFASQAYLEQHVHTHNTKKIHQCSYCSKTFQSLPSLSQHKQVHQTTEAKCQLCNISFKTKRYLYQHQKRKHGQDEDEACGEVKFKCHVCGKVLSDRSVLASHLRIHTGEKPYDCEICGAKFRFHSSLNTHLKMHRNERTNACQFCAKKFLQASDLRKHIRIHTNEKPYACHLCGKRFARVDYKNKHLLVHQKRALKGLEGKQGDPDTDLGKGQEESIKENEEMPLFAETILGLDDLSQDESMQLVMDN